MLHYVGTCLLMHQINSVMRPGDLIEWTYTHNNQLVVKREMLWSTPMNRWVPIGSGLVHTIVSIDKKRIAWLNEEGCFHACVNDTGILSVTPRTTLCGSSDAGSDARSCVRSLRVISDESRG